MKPDRTTRREFLYRTAGGAAATLLAGSRAMASAPETTSKPWRMKLSTSSIHFKQLPIEQACERIAALGFEAIDIWSAYQQCPHLDDALTRLGPAGLKKLLARHKLELFAFSTYVGGYPKYAQLLGQSGGGVAIQGSAPPCPPAQLTTRMKAFLESLKPLVDLAEQHDSYLAVENHGNALLDSLDSFKTFVDLNPWPRLGLALAPYHLQAIHASVEEAVGICGSQLLFFYAWQKGPALNQLPGHGPTDFKPWIKALAKVKYGGYVNPFMHDLIKPDIMSRALAKSRDYLTGLT
jgi:sugar phosphate isomerase/epimerase